MPARILAFAGSARRESFNRRLITIAANGARQAGADVTLIELHDYPLPLFDQDFEAEQGLPTNALALKKLFLDHDGLLISSPEYNSSITPLLKNTIDWVSRSSPGETSLAAYKGKAAALMAASPGRLGGLRGLVHVRSILSNIGVLVLPDQVAVSQADQAFADDGRLRDDKQHASVERLGRSLAELLLKLKS
jgi:NAD(P)H-dependent FMN reductase